MTWNFTNKNIYNYDYIILDIDIFQFNIYVVWIWNKFLSYLWLVYEIKNVSLLTILDLTIMIF